MAPSQSARIDDLMRYVIPVHPVPLYLGCHLPKYSLESRGPQGAFPNLNAVYISMGNALKKCLGLELHFDFFLHSEPDPSCYNSNHLILWLCWSQCVPGEAQSLSNTPGGACPKIITVLCCCLVQKKMYFENLEGHFTLLSLKCFAASATDDRGHGDNCDE